MRTLEQTIDYINKTKLSELIDNFTRDYKISVNKSRKKFRNSYLEYFKENGDVGRFIAHKYFDRFNWEKSIDHTFFEEIDPAIYCSDNGSEPSFFNAIKHLKTNIGEINKMTFKDEKSRDVLNWLINYRLTGNKLLFFEESTPIEESYFDRDYIMPWVGEQNNMMCIDMGGFDGDTAIGMYNRISGSRIISFEPDKENYKKLKKNCSMYKDRIKFINKGCGEKNRYVALGGYGDSVYIVENPVDKRDLIEICSLDDEVEKKVDYIKMDIEGSELSALKGAKNHIISDNPNMAVCIYHKIEDFLDIYNYIKGLSDRYSFVMRHYGVGRSEVVLYAIYD